MNDDHLYIGALDWESFVSRCENLCSAHLHLGADGKPSFDGDNETDGYSLDWLHEQFESGARPLDVLHRLLWRKHGLHRPAPRGAQ